MEIFLALKIILLSYEGFSLCKKWLEFKELRTKTTKKRFKFIIGIATDVIIYKHSNVGCLMSEELWRKDYAFFSNQLPSLLKTNKGHFAIVKDQTILKVFNTEPEARKYVEDKKFEQGTFLVQEITDRVEYISRVSI